MNRTINFRAKRTDGRGWAYGYFVKTPITAEFNDVDGAYFDSGKSRYCIVTEHGVAHEIDIKTLGQDTGLHDKNGVEIWEGNIVKWIDGDDEISTVIFEAGGFWLDNHDNEYGWPPAEDLEVIGNIWEDPKGAKPGYIKE